MSRTARSGALSFAIAFVAEPLGGCRGRYDVEVRQGRRAIAEVAVGAPTALLSDPEGKSAAKEIAETVAHYLLSDDAQLPIERDDERVIVRV